jgi:hypothetical protein
MAGTGHEVVGPEFLQTYRPDTAIVMNPVYLDEIAAQLSSMGVSCELVGA